VYTPVFAEPPQSWREWWTAVRRFAAGWYDVAPGDVRGYDPEVAELERQAGRPLSPSIHEWAAFVADLRRANVFGRAFRDRCTLGLDPGTGAVTLLTLIEGDVCWAVHEHEAYRDDPPVDVWRPARMGQRQWDWWRRHTPTTSQFALQHMLAYLYTAAGGLSVKLPPSDELLIQLQDAGQTSTDLGDQVLIEDDDLVILVGKSLWGIDGETDITVDVAIGPGRAVATPSRASSST
jgi:hypothetical protein